MRTLLDLDNARDLPDLRARLSGKLLLISANPDLKTDFGHFLNYERRLRELSSAVGADYFCLAHREVNVKEDFIRPVFPHDSGHYSLVRAAARSKETEIAAQFAEVLNKQLATVAQQYDRVNVFLYCGSSLLASHLCGLIKAPNVTVVVNAFWDFLLPAQFQHYKHVAKLALQSQIRLLAMSELHRTELMQHSGLAFDWIANPPPLMADLAALASVKQALAFAPAAQTPTVFLPGLMTAGKGKELTKALCDFVATKKEPGVRYIVRDRLNELPSRQYPGLEILKGDLAESTIIETYRRAQFAVLPYDAQTFRVRTSGAIVDCMTFGTIPIVLAGTWLAHICRKYGFGLVMEELTPAGIESAVRAHAQEIPTLRQNVLTGAYGYLRDNSWARLLATIFGGVRQAAPAVSAPIDSKTAFQEANRLFRAGSYSEAAKIYSWLWEQRKLPMYKFNLDWTLRRQEAQQKSTAQSGASSSLQ